MNTIFFNNNDNRNLSGEIISQIENAKKWIKCCNLFFDDDNIRDKLLEAVHLGKAVFILTNLEGVSGEIYTNKKTGKKRFTPQTTQNIMHSKSIAQLFEAGAHISGLDGLHAKFLLTDNKVGIVTSLNFTTNSMDKITEIGVQLTDKDFEELENVFDNLFLRPDEFKFASHNNHFSYERPSKPIDCEPFSKFSNVKMTLAPTTRGRGAALAKCNIFSLRDEILNIINSTENDDDLYIATYSLEPKAIVNTENGETLEEALYNARKRKIKLHILMRKEKQRVINGIYIHYHKDNHAKVVMNSRRGIIFTGNLTTESFTSGFDLGVILTPDQINETKKFIDELIKQTEQ